MMPMKTEAEEDEEEAEELDQSTELEITEIGLREVIDREDQALEDLEESLASHLEDLGGEKALPLKEKLTRLANEYWNRIS
jgi:hypothetical protein